MQFKFYKKISFIIILSLPIISNAAILTSPRQTSLPTPQAAVASGDLNEDGFPDLIIGGDPGVSELGKIRVLLGKGNGNFYSLQQYQVGYNPNSAFISPYVQCIKVADLNNDGNLDVVVAHNGQRSQFNSSDVLITVLFGDGMGNLQTTDSYIFFDGEDKTVTSIDFTDFNRDGKIDVILGCIAGTLGKIFGLRNLGGGSFQTVGPKVTGAPVFDIASTFTNDDLNPDIVMTTTRGITIVYGDGAFFSSFGEELDSLIFEASLVVRDFNSDGKPDIAVTERANPRLRVFLKGKNGYPANPIVYQTNFISTLMRSVDINGDARPDLIITHTSNGNFQILYGNADGSFGNSETKINNLAVSDLAFADFDLNGKTDIAVSLFAESPSKQAAVMLNAPNPKRYLADFDRDKKIDISIYRPSVGEWWYLQSSNDQNRALQFGSSSDVIVPGDYTGDGKTDVAVWRALTGEWFVLRSDDLSYYAVPFGQTGDIPAPGDFDNDGKTDLAVFRPGTGTWFIQLATGEIIIQRFGINGDKPMAADYDGDGKADIAIWRRSTGEWWINRSAEGVIAYKFGTETDEPVAADYTGDGRTDVAFFRPQSGFWFILRSEDLSYYAAPFGLNGDIPAAGDYDGDGKADLAVFRPGDGVWYLQRSKSGFAALQFGLATDKPVPAAN